MNKLELEKCNCVEVLEHEIIVNKTREEKVHKLCGGFLPYVS